MSSRERTTCLMMIALLERTRNSCSAIGMKIHLPMETPHAGLPAYLRMNFKKTNKKALNSMKLPSLVIK